MEKQKAKFNILSRCDKTSASRSRMEAWSGFPDEIVGTSRSARGGIFRKPPRLIRGGASFLIFICIFFVCCTADADDTPFGVGTFFSWNHEWNSYMYKDEKDIERAVVLLKELGVSIVRQEFSWNEIEKEKDVFDFKRYDYIVQVCRKNDIEILGILGFTAPWTGQQWNSAPNDEDLFLKYVRTV